MDAAIDTMRAFAALVGQAWFIAAGATFLVMAFESAKPRSIEGQHEPKASALQRLAMILSLVAPFLLFLSAFGAATISRQAHGEGTPQDNGLGLGLIVAFIAFGLGPSILGWLIGAISRPLSDLLRRLAPFLAIAVFAYVVYVTYQNAFYVLNEFVLIRMR